jgi:hypothetical protein
MIAQWSMVVHACNPSTREVEAGRFQDQGQPTLHRDLVSK